MGISTDGLLFYGYVLPEEVQMDLDTVNDMKDEHCEVVVHCAWSYPMLAVAISETIKNAARGYPEEISPILICVDEKTLTRWDEHLREFLVKTGLLQKAQAWEEEVKGPAWWLASIWG